MGIIKIDEILKHLGVCDRCGILTYKKIAATYGKCAACGYTGNN